MASTEARRSQDGPSTDEETCITNIIIFHGTGCETTDWMMSDGSCRPMIADLAVANHVASNLALTSPEPLRRRRRA